MWVPWMNVWAETVSAELWAVERQKGDFAMGKWHITLLCLALAMVLSTCSGGEPSVSDEPSPNLPDDVRRGEVAGDAAYPPRTMSP